MMLAHLTAPMLTRELRTHLARGTMNTGDILITWDAAPAPADLNVEADYPAEDLRSVALKAYIHHVSVKAAQSNWTMFQAGDVIVTFDAEHLDLESKRTVSFILPDGFTYTQKDTDRDPVEFWSTFVGGRTLTKTILLRRQSDRLRLGLVYYVADGGARSLLYTYSLGSHRFTAIGDTSLALIDDSDTTRVTITIGNETALVATAAGVETGQILALGHSVLSDEPRLEFWVGAVRCAGLSATRLAVADLAESMLAPSDPRQMAVGNPSWIFSFGGTRAVAASFIEGDLPDVPVTDSDKSAQSLLLWGLFPLPF